MKLQYHTHTQSYSLYTLLLLICALETQHLCLILFISTVTVEQGNTVCHVYNCICCIIKCIPDRRELLSMRINSSSHNFTHLVFGRILHRAALSSQTCVPSQIRMPPYRSHTLRAMTLGESGRWT